MSKLTFIKEFEKLIQDNFSLPQGQFEGLKILLMRHCCLLFSRVIISKSSTLTVTPTGLYSRTLLSN